MKEDKLPEIARVLYEALEYYREYVPYMVNATHEEYAKTKEAQGVDAALKMYRDETGAKPAYGYRDETRVNRTYET